MSLLGTAERTVEGATGIAWADIAVRVLLALAVAAAIGFALWWFLIRPAGLAKEAEQAKVETHVAQGAAAAGIEAVKITTERQHLDVVITQRTQEGQDAVHHAEGAQVASPAVAAALRAAVCGMQPYQSERDCAPVSAAGGGIGVAGADTRSGAAGR